VQTQDKPQNTPETAAEETVQPKPARSGRSIPWWASLSVALNGGLLLAISLLYWKPALMGVNVPSPVPVEPVATEPEIKATERPTLPYEQWVEISAKEAKAIALKNPDRLTVLLGDSLTLWFPSELLSDRRTWLNQAISGENTTGLLKRLNLLKELKPETFLLMIGVNDMIKGGSDEQVITNHQKIIDELKTNHPQAEIVVQSILPHGADRLTVEDAAQVATVSNERIVQLNRKIRELATQKEVKFLDLQPVFTDAQGLLREDLSTDGLHLNSQGYAAWQGAIQTFDQLSLKQPAPAAAEASPEATPEAEAAPEAETPKAEAEPKAEVAPKTEASPIN
jgi:lysophospholipase L1-like esterase